MGNPLPPIPPIYSYTQIPLKNQNLIPLQELGAAGGYDRLILLPDDIPPVIALPWALGHTNIPHLNRCEEDGSLDVFVKGGGQNTALDANGGAAYVSTGNAGQAQIADGGSFSFVGQDMGKYVTAISGNAVLTAITVAGTPAILAGLWKDLGGNSYDLGRWGAVTVGTVVDLTHYYNPPMNLDALVPHGGEISPVLTATGGAWFVCLSVDTFFASIEQP